MSAEGDKLVDNEYNGYKDKSEIYKKETKIINFTYFVACKDPQHAADFLYKTLKKKGKEENFPILKEKVANLLEQNQYSEQAKLLRKIKMEEK